MGSDALLSIVGVAATITVVALPILLWRIYEIYTFYARAIIVVGQIAETTVRGKTGYVQYSYTYEGKWHIETTSLPAKRSTEFPAGTECNVLVDPKKPSSSYLARKFSD